MAVSETGVRTFKSLGLGVGDFDAKVWALFNNAGTIEDSFNVDSVTDTGTGNWTVNFTTDFANTSYCNLARCDTTSPGAVMQLPDADKAVGSARIFNKRTDNQAVIDAGVNTNYVAYGDQ